ncbi:hypothetical protein GCM10027280_39370 [Micromonospora polyrhachis]|uniref:DUF4190 domain-containing protein n=1 Tax=Micromonospora polyrhachis TaxID=1282883 RepID=A0A7W7WQR8_9ACTN|nr:DUF4190 domain-containing protein [Micromonospora polyrhachis]MBB4959792.1 hypothetical protein [Micromonospora polyrhachis]
MSYPNWNDPSQGTQEPAGYPDPNQPVSKYPVSGQPISGYPVSGQPVNPDGTPAGAYPGYGYPMIAAAPPTNGMSIAALVVSIVGILGLCGYGLGGYIGIIGAILGHVSRRQIREKGESGDGMALAGIIVGWIATAIALIATLAIIGFIVWAANYEPTTDYGTTD